MKYGLIVAAAACVAIPSAAQQAPTPQQGVRINFNLSPAGQAIAKRYLTTPDPQAKPLADRANAIAQRQRALLSAPKLDLAQFAAGLREQEKLRGQVVRLANERMLKMLGEMNDADRLGFLRGLANPTSAAAPPKK